MQISGPAISPPKSAQARSVLKEIAVVVGAQGGLGLCGFITGTAAARLLGPAARGELAAIQVSGALLATFATLGMSEATTLYCAREPENARSYVSSAMLLSIVVGTPILLLGFLAVPYLLAAQSPIVVHAARWYMLIILFYIFFNFPLSAIRGLGQYALWSAFRYVTPIASLIALLVAWLSGWISPGFIALCGLMITGMISLPAVCFVILPRLVGTWWPNPASWLPMLRFSTPLAASALPKQLNLRLDQMMMAALLPPRLLGLYVVAAAWSTMTAPVLEGVGAFLFPHVASHQSFDEQARALVRITKLATPVALVQIVAFCLFTPVGLILVFGEPYHESVPAALVLVVAGATLYLGQLLEEGLRGLGKPLPVMWAEFGGLAITGISLLALLRPMGIMGAAISSLLGYSVVWYILVVKIRSITGFSFAEILLPSSTELRNGWIMLGEFDWNR
jgi:O-antigen/teichoic acid export membrane protein